MRKKISIIGAGNVGATTAHVIAERGAGDVVLVDIIEGLPQGKGLDLQEALPILNVDARITGTQSYEDTKDSDIVIITAGLPRKPGMSRDDLLATNAKIVSEVTRQVAFYSPNSILIIVTNPLDAMAYLAYKISKFPSHRVLGMAGVLDSARFRAFIAMELNVSVENIHAFVLGGHGDDMVPLPRYSTVAGVPLTDLMDETTIQRIVDRTRKGGGEIVSLLKTGSAFYAPAAAIYDMVDAILNDRRKILPCAVYCQGEYGAHDIFFGVPAILGNRGVEKIFEIQLLPDEKTALDKSIQSVQSLVDKLQY